MCEDMRTKKQRLNPNGAENCGVREFGRRLRRADKRRMGGVFVAARRNRRNRTTVLATARIGMNSLVQSR